MIWGRWQPGGLGRTKYQACRGAFALCFLVTLFLVIADPTANGVVNRIVIGALFIIGTIMTHFLRRRDIRDSALIDGAEVKEQSRRSVGVSMVSTIKVAVEPPPDDIESFPQNISPQDNLTPSSLSIQPRLTDNTGSSDVPLDTEAQIAHSTNNITTTSKDRYLSRKMSYEFVCDARRGRLINDMYMSKAMAILGQVVGWYCFIFIVELCVFAYFVTNYGSPPKVCPTISAILLPMCQLVVDSLF